MRSRRTKTSTMRTSAISMNEVDMRSCSGRRPTTSSDLTGMRSADGRCLRCTQGATAGAATDMALHLRLRQRARRSRRQHPRPMVKLRMSADASGRFIDSMARGLAGGHSCLCTEAQALRLQRAMLLFWRSAAIAAREAVQGGNLRADISNSCGCLIRDLTEQDISTAPTLVSIGVGKACFSAAKTPTSTTIRITEVAASVSRSLALRRRRQDRLPGFFGGHGFAAARQVAGSHRCQRKLRKG